MASEDGTLVAPVGMTQVSPLEGVPPELALNLEPSAPPLANDSTPPQGVAAAIVALPAATPTEPAPVLDASAHAATAGYVRCWRGRTARGACARTWPTCCADIVRRRCAAGIIAVLRASCSLNRPKLQYCGPSGLTAWQDGAAMQLQTS